MASNTFDAAVISWLQTLELSIDVKNPKRDLANGCVIAEILARYFPQDVSLHSFENVSSLQLKDANWHLLLKLFRKLGLAIDESMAKSVMLCENGAAVELMTLIWQFLLESPASLRISADLGSAPLQQNASAQPCATAAGQGKSSVEMHDPLLDHGGWGKPGQRPAVSWEEECSEAQAYGDSTAAPAFWLHDGGRTAAVDCTTAVWQPISQVLQEQAPQYAELMYAQASAPLEAPYYASVGAAAWLQQYPQPFVSQEAAMHMAAQAQQWQWGGQDAQAMQWQLQQQLSQQPMHAVQHQQPAPGSRRTAARPRGSATRRPTREPTPAAAVEQCWQAQPMLLPQQPFDVARAAIWQQQLDVQGCWQQPAGVVWASPQPMAEQQVPPLASRPQSRPRREPSFAGAAVPQQPPPHPLLQADPQVHLTVADMAVDSALAPEEGEQHWQHSTTAMSATDATPAADSQPADTNPPQRGGSTDANSHAAAPTLAFDRQPRAVDFRPYTQQEFEDRHFDARRAEKYWELGLLGPVPDEGLAAKQAARQRVHEFGRRTFMENRKRLAAQAASRPPSTEERQRPASARERALQFSRLVQRPTSCGMLMRSATARLPSVDGGSGGGDAANGAARLAVIRREAELARLQAQHAADQADVAAIAGDLRRKGATGQPATA